VEARRQLWNLLRSLKSGNQSNSTGPLDSTVQRNCRTILLTTHYMDEAEYLGDRVGIMAHGKMQTIGSPGFLKKVYGSGHRLVLEKEPHQSVSQREALHKLILSVIPTSSIEADGTDATQTIYSLPTNMAANYSILFQQLEDTLRRCFVLFPR
jgi:ATP-binding cassette subfamily A (ABC1) protein 3